MQIHRYLVRLLLIFLLGFSIAENASGGLRVSGLTPAESGGNLAPCSMTAAGMSAQNSNKICWWNTDATADGKIYTIRDTTLSGSNGFAASGPLGQSYVPYSATWKLLYFVCQLVVDNGYPRRSCSIAKAAKHYESTAASVINSTSNINAQNVDFTTGNGNIPKASSLCYALADVNNPTIYWRSNDARMCADANTLPSVPATCYLNYQQALNVDLGTLERSSIATTAHSGDKGNVTKPVQILCTRDGGVTVKTTFQYKTIAINSVGVVSTENNALGVAIIYKGQVVTPSSSFLETFNSGYTTVNLEFEAVRDSTISTDNLPTGAFTASAVMVMTEQ